MSANGLVFEDMAIYTMVKTTTFNGIRLPGIAIWNSTTDEAPRRARSSATRSSRTRFS